MRSYDQSPNFTVQHFIPNRDTLLQLPRYPERLKCEVRLTFDVLETELNSNNVVIHPSYYRFASVRDTTISSWIKKKTGRFSFHESELVSNKTSRDSLPPTAISIDSFVSILGRSNIKYNVYAFHKLQSNR